MHVADVAALVAPDSPADLEARERGANLYLPEGTVPMLPTEATQRLGLGLSERSPALSFGLRLDGYGGIADIEVVLSWVRVTRLSYKQVDDRLDEEPFRSLYALAQVFENRRYRNGAISLDLPEVKILAQDGQVQIKPVPTLNSRAMVLEAMLMAGEAVAKLASSQHLAMPYTTQEHPSRWIRQTHWPVCLPGAVPFRRATRALCRLRTPAWDWRVTYARPARCGAIWI